jgi:hypothetical protein
MGIGVALLLIAAGAILLWVVKVAVIGGILLAVGIVGIVLAMIFWSTWGGFGRRETTVVEEHRV